MKYTPEEIKYRLSDLGVQIGNIAIEYIAELEKEKCELLGIIQGKDKAIKDLEWQLQEVAKDNDNYQKENAELKARLQKKINTTTVSDYPYSALKLEEAKEIIKELCSMVRELNKPNVQLTNVDYSLATAEQFLKDSEGK